MGTETPWGEEVGNVAAVELLMAVGVSRWGAFERQALLAEFTLADGRLLSLWDEGPDHGTVWRLSAGGGDGR